MAYANEASYNNDLIRDLAEMADILYYQSDIDGYDLFVKVLW